MLTQLPGQQPAQTQAEYIGSLLREERIRLEFGETIKKIAEAAKSDPAAAVGLYEQIEEALERRVADITRAAFTAGRWRGRDDERKLIEGLAQGA